MEANGIRMNKFFQRLFLFEKCEIKTKLSKQEILNRVTSFVDYEHRDYYGSVSECGFLLEKRTESILQADTPKIHLLP